MSENPTQKIRRKITQDFCRTVLWIDDEIRPDAETPPKNERLEKDYEGKQHQEFFLPTASEFQSLGYLVHLHPYERPSDEALKGTNPFSEESGHHQSACTLAHKADIIILDWHLADRESPQHSIRILKELVKSQASRFVVILSKYWDKFAQEIKDAELGFEQGTTTSGMDFWTHDSGIHLVLAKKYPKGDDNRIIAPEILAVVDDLIQSAHPDYIHWAAFEIATRLRNHIPAWLKAIPRGTDMALLQELFAENSEGRQYIPENILEDLVAVVQATELETLSATHTSRENWLNRPSGVSEEAGTNNEKMVNLLVSAEAMDAKQISKLATSSPDIPAHAAWLDSHQVFVEFCEKLSQVDYDRPPRPGAVYKKRNPVVAERKVIYLCASQACDCSRGDSPLILLKAVTTSEVKLGSSVLRYGGEDYRFDSNSESLILAEVNENDGKRILTDYELIGQLRPAIAARITSRFWIGTTRPAVNHPTFARKLRAKE